jgi:hypothetical protein
VTAAGSFLTVADDARHVGELLGVGSVLYIGLSRRGGRDEVEFRPGGDPFPGRRRWSWRGHGRRDDPHAGGVLGGSIIGAWVAAVVDRRRERVSE